MKFSVMLSLLLVTLLSAASPASAEGGKERLGRITGIEIQLLCLEPGVETLEIDVDGVLVTINCDELPYDPNYPGSD